MRLGDRWRVVDQTESTQTLAADSFEWDVVLAYDQTGGRGRFGREWHSAPGDSLTMSLVFHEYIGHPRPWLIGMAVGLAAAQVIGSKIQWPNDLVIERKKVGGVLTEMRQGMWGDLVPIVGVGINLNQKSFHPNVEAFATSLYQAFGAYREASEIANLIAQKIREFPEPEQWRDIEQQWTNLDDTPGKLYKLVNGGVAVADSIGSQGELIAFQGGERLTILAAEAIFSAG